MSKKIFILLFIAAMTIFVMQKLETYLPEIINNYANDLLCLPLVLGSILYIIRRLKNDSNFQLPLVFILLMATYYSVYFEYYLPSYNSRYTSDWIDVGLYFLGAFAFYGYESVRNRKVFLNCI